MKKRIALILAIVVVLVAFVGVAFAVFGGGGNKLTVTKEDGTTETISVKKLLSICAKDGRTKESYMGCEVSGSGKISAIREAFFVSESSSDYYHLEYAFGDIGRGQQFMELFLGEGVVLLIREEFVDGLYVGDTVKYEGVIDAMGVGARIYVNCADTKAVNTKQRVFLVVPSNAK